MFPPGHVALGIHLVRRLPRLASGHAATAALLLGTLTPDLLDKALQWTGVYPWGRTWGHSIIGNAVLGLISLALWVIAQPSSPSESESAPAAESGTPTSESAPGPAGPDSLRTAAALLTCLCIGQWSHLVADVWNDLEQGAMNTGYLWSAWMAWPWMTPDDLPCTMSPWLPGRRWITLSEALVVVLALRLGLGSRAKPGSPATRGKSTGKNETAG